MYILLALNELNIILFSWSYLLLTIVIPARVLYWIYRNNMWVSVFIDEKKNASKHLSYFRNGNTFSLTLFFI